MTPRTFEQAREMGERNRAAARRTRARMEARPGGLAAALDCLRIVSLAPGMSSFRPLMKEYHRVLATGILPDELVPLEEFDQALGAKNEDRRLVPVLGPYRYFCLAVNEAEAGMVGAAGFAVFCHPSHPATIHTSYCVLLPEFRGFGAGRRLLQAITRQALGFIRSVQPGDGDGTPVLQFIECNDLATMKLGDRLLDEAISMHPLKRDRLWEGCGFAELPDAGYHQRASPHLPFALKLLGVHADGTSHRPTVVSASDVVRHVCAFDNLLLNFDDAAGRAEAGRPLRDPRSEGLLAPFDMAAQLPTRTPADAAARIEALARFDRDLAVRCAGRALAMDWTLQECREHCDDA